MLGLFKSEPFRDGQLGELRRSGGCWKGSLVVAPCGTFRLALAGSREAPDPIALGLAKELPDRFKSLMPKIQTGYLNTTRRIKKRLMLANRPAVPARALRVRRRCGHTSRLPMFLSSPLKAFRRSKLASGSHGTKNTLSAHGFRIGSSSS